MARKVFISSAISGDEEISEVAEIDPMIALLWPWFLTYFDDWGRAKASPREIKNHVFQANELVTIDIIKKAIQLFSNKLLIVYEVAGKWYMAVPPDKWFKWQTHIRRDKRENDGSKIPPPPDDSSAQMREIARGFAEVSAGARDYTPSPSPSPSPTPSPSKNSSSRSSRENPFGLFETHKFGQLDDLTKDAIGHAIDDYSEHWVIEAIKETVLQNKIAWKYVIRILQRWMTLNHPEPWTVERPQEQRPTGNVAPFQRRPVSGKQQIPIVKPETGQAVSEERLAQIRAKAKKLDDEFNHRNPEVLHATADQPY